ncbi:MULTISPECIES: sensor histidine kinase [unclassified Minwuia]|uniref:sensor histidine kinase n=1 Tax=unclassified Minwuia TaxID=2618799 RepID=UPI00247AD500|nr:MULTISPECIES: sensor histidine kinase [unclassified Minwuia]
MAYAFDESGTADLQNARRLTFADGPMQSLHLGFSDRPLWLRLTMTNRAAEALSAVLVYRFPYIDSVTAYLPRPEGGEPVRIARGDSLPLPESFRQSHFPAFPVHLPAMATTVVYLQVQSTSVLLAPLELLSEKRFARELMLDQILLGLLFGAVIAVCLYVLTVYLTVRDKAYLDFVPFSLSYALYVAVATGFGQVWIWPEAWQHANLLYFVVQGLLFASGVRFFQRYLNTAEHTPRINIAMRLLIIAGLLTTVSPFLPKPIDTLLIAFVAGPGAVLVLGTAIYLWIRGVDNAAVVTVGWAFSHVTSVYLYLRVFDITPYLEVNHYLTAIGCAIATLYFAIAQALGLRRQQAKLLLAETINDTRNQFMAGMSHELRTPLNAIMGFSEMMKEQMLGPIQPSAYRDYAADIHASSQNMLKLVDDVLDISRIESGHYELNVQPTDLVDLAQACIARFATEAASAGIQVHLRHDRDAVMATVDAEAVTRALCNVLDNAIKYSAPESEVSVAIAGDRGQIRLSVSDSGQGIPEEMMEQVVRPFELVRTNAYSAKTGAGLGLPVARMLVELHGGRLEIDSDEGKGTSVAFLMPAD